ncbi:MULTISPECIES: hypothetical protein [unclassified Pseudomonas]|uniref:hypothetical protein n=1 Tax=unclassified Pseudomonas TaxID=196821 RepID=UPI001C449617|nr:MULTISPECIES: hypothetical protein [unclassified Pseudomonas]
MKNFSVKCIALAVTLSSLALTAQANTVYIHAGRLVDVERGKVLTDQRIKVEGDRIVAVEPWSRGVHRRPIAK